MQSFNDGINPNKPIPHVESESKLGVHDSLDINKVFPIRMDTAELVQKSVLIHAIYGGSENQIGVVGQSTKSIGIWGEGVFGVYGYSSSPTGDGVTGIGKRGVVGESDDAEGVFGSSRTGCGTMGESAALDGVKGVSHSSTHSGVFGHNINGIGVSGHSNTNTGISGTSEQGVGVHAKGGSLAALFEGDVEITGDIRMSNADCAEDFDIACQEGVEPGTVMVLGEEGLLHPSDKSYDKRVAGVISGAGCYRPGIILDKHISVNTRQPIALLGKVYCKVDAQYGEVEVGDLLTTSATPGHAMKAGEAFKAFGSVIGKALRPLKNGCDLIPILITLQ
jgi:hypothetical protein